MSNNSNSNNNNSCNNNNDTLFAATPKNNYYACIFTSQRTQNDNEQYYEMAKEMHELAKLQPGYLGIESARNSDNLFGITISYWDSLKSIKDWKENSNHKIAQQFGKESWYKHYEVRICEVKYSYSKAQ